MNNSGTDTATVTITVSGANAPPLTNNDTAGTQEDTSVVIDVLANDTDPNGDVLHIHSVGLAQNGTVTQNGDGTLTFTPDPGFSGTDTFRYTVADPHGQRESASVTVNVAPANDAPQAVNDTASTQQGTPVTISVLANDVDPDGDPLQILSTGLAGHGAVTEHPNGTITYTPDNGFSGTDSFTYTAVDNHGAQSAATVTVTVNAINRVPHVVADTASTRKDTAVVIDVLANDSDPDGDALSIMRTTAASHGDVLINPNGTLTYTPDSGYVGSDTFKYTAIDPHGLRESIYVSIDVTDGNTAPDAANDIANTTEDTAVIINVLANDTDDDGDTLAIQSISPAANGSVTQNPDGTLTYTPNAGFVGTDVFSYTAADSNGGADTAGVTVTVGPANPHDPGTIHHGEHAALLNLVKHADATHVAVSNGSWFDPDTWSTNQVPGDDARVLIPNGIAVDYDGVSDARLFTVRVDGELHFATDTDSKMVVDTFVVAHTGTMTAGTDANPVAANVNVDIVIADNGDIDTTWDPGLLSRGLISHGEVQIHGQEKAAHLKVATDPMAGDTSITLAEVPLNWQVGDTVVLTGTEYDGYVWQYATSTFRPPEDEVLTITGIQGQTIHFAETLQYDHATPRADLKASVANYTRNVSIESENGAAAETHHRGHVMFMHNDNVDVRFAEFYELGRTDKSFLAKNAHEFTDLASDSNVKGRYSFHIHKTGFDDLANPAIAEGNAVFGSPGWGFVHHDSNAILHGNATYNTFGAGYVAETGNETGTWSDNIAIYAKGVNWGIAKNQNNGGRFDSGKGGDGYFFQGRMVEAFDNVAASVNHGFTYFHRGRYENPANGLDGQIKFDPALFDLPEALGAGPVSVSVAPIRNFSGNEVFAANEGLHIVKDNPHQGHDVQSHISDFTAWEVNVGAFFDYSGHYILEDLDLIGKAVPARAGAVGDGIVFAQNTVDMTVLNPQIASFQNGINLRKNFSFSEDISVTQYKVVNPVFSDIAKQNLANYTPGVDEVLSSGELQPGEFVLNLDSPLFFDPSNPVVRITGTKTDGIGTIDVPAGTDGYSTGSPTGFNAKKAEIFNILEEDGYYSAGDKNYFILEDYYTDRSTGEIFKTGHVVEMDGSVDRILGKQNPYKNAIYAGEINLANIAPNTQDDSASTQIETDVIIDLLQNDFDADGDQLEIDGIVQPLYGRVFDNGDGTITYRPHLDFTGTETFKYWASDNQGGFTEGWVTVDVWGV